MSIKDRKKIARTCDHQVYTINYIKNCKSSGKLDHLYKKPPGEESPDGLITQKYQFLGDIDHSFRLSLGFITFW